MSNRKYDAILYDLDGTLIDSVPVIIDSFIKTYNEIFGCCTRSEEDIKRYIGKPLVESFERCDKELIPTLVDKYLELNCQMLRDDKVELFPGVIEGLEHLKSLGYKQGIMTSKKRESAIITIDLKGFDKYFDTYVFCEDTNLHKPNPEPLIKCANNIGIEDMSRVLYVGDAIPDAQCAVAAGADFALVNWTQMEKDKILADYPAKLIYSIKDIADI